MDANVIDLDIKRMLESIEFEDVVRYRHDPSWVKENELQDEIDKNPLKRLESDADHSWHLADMVLLIGPHFPDLNIDKAIKLAILHDKLEIFTGDDIVVGLSGTGLDSHALNEKLKQEKIDKENEALTSYLQSLPEDVATYQRPMFEEYLAKSSPEARFVNALDKMQVLVRILYAKKGESGPFGGRSSTTWWKVVEKYHRPKLAQFPPLIPYSDKLLDLIKAKSY